MYAEQIRRYLDAYDGKPPRVRLTYVDLTIGETSGVYFAEGPRGLFPSIYEFAAEALISIEHHMTGEETATYPQSAWSELEAFSCDALPWMNFYNQIVRPGEMLCFPTEQVLGFKPPVNLERKLYLTPHFSGTEECIATQNIDVYALLYWHTTG